MKKRLIVLLLLVAVLCMSTFPALATVLRTSTLPAQAEDTGFNASLQITRTATAVRVTVQDSKVLEEHTPKLQIPCTGMDWGYAKVTFGGETLSGVSWDAATQTVSFPVAKGGEYTIESQPRPAASISASYAEGSQEDGNLVIDVSAELPEELKEAVLICAAYGEAERMIAVSVQEDGISAKQQISLNCQVGEVKEVKVFLLDRANGYRPVCEAAIIGQP